MGGVQADNGEGERTQGLTFKVDPSALVPAIGTTMWSWTIEFSLWLNILHLLKRANVRRMKLKVSRGVSWKQFHKRKKRMQQQCLFPSGTPETVGNIPIYMAKHLVNAELCEFQRTSWVLKAGGYNIRDGTGAIARSCNCIFMLGYKWRSCSLTQLSEKLSSLCSL